MQKIGFDWSLIFHLVNYIIVDVKTALIVDLQTYPIVIVRILQNQRHKETTKMDQVVGKENLEETYKVKHAIPNVVGKEN